MKKEVEMKKCAICGDEFVKYGNRNICEKVECEVTRQKQIQKAKDIRSMTKEQVKSYRWAIQFANIMPEQEKILVNILLDQREKFLRAKI